MDHHGDEGNGRDEAGAEDGPGERVPDGRIAASLRDGPIPAIPRCAPAGDQAIADPGYPHLLAGSGCGGRDEQVSRQPGGRRPRSSAARSTPGARLRRALSAMRDCQKRQRRVNGHEQRQRDSEPQDPAACREKRHVHVVEDKHLIAEHGEPVQVFRALVVLDRRNGRLKLGHVRLEGDRQAVTKPALGAIAHDPQKPGQGRGCSEAQCRGHGEATVVCQRGVGQGLEPERKQGVGQGREQRE